DVMHMRCNTRRKESYGPAGPHEIAVRWLPGLGRLGCRTSPTPRPFATRRLALLDRSLATLWLSLARASRRRALAARGEDAGEERLELLALDRLLLDEQPRKPIQHGALLGESLLGPVVRAVDDFPNLFVDLRRHLIGVVALLADLAAQEDHLLLLTEGQRAELVAHAVLRNHRAGKVGGLLDVVGGTGGRVTEHDLLGDVAPQHPGELVLEFALGVEVSVLGRQAHGVAERHA